VCKAQSRTIEKKATHSHARTLVSCTSYKAIALCDDCATTIPCKSCCVLLSSRQLQLVREAGQPQLLPLWAGAAHAIVQAARAEQAGLGAGGGLVSADVLSFLREGDE